MTAIPTIKRIAQGCTLGSLRAARAPASAFRHITLL